MVGLNRITLIGNLGQEPQTRQTQGGSQVANLRLATNEKWRDRSSGEMKTSTEWHNVVAFGSTAEFVSRYLAKGSLIYVEGRIQTRKWQDKNGADRYTTEVIAQSMQILDTNKVEQPSDFPDGSNDFPDIDDGFDKCPF